VNVNTFCCTYYFSFDKGGKRKAAFTVNIIGLRILPFSFKCSILCIYRITDIFQYITLNDRSLKCHVTRFLRFNIPPIFYNLRPKRQYNIWVILTQIKFNRLTISVIELYSKETMFCYKTFDTKAILTTSKSIC